MAELVASVFLACAAGAILVSGAGGVVARRIATRTSRDLTGSAAVAMGLALLAASGVVTWAAASLVGSRTEVSPSRAGWAAAFAVAGTFATALLAWGSTERLRARRRLSDDEFVGRRARRWTVPIATAAAVEIWVIVFLATR